MTCLIAVGLWVYTWSNSIWYAIGFPAITMTAWAVFAVPGDKSRSGNAPVPTPGIARLLLEIAFFGLGTWALLDMGFSIPAWTFAGVTTLHYTLSVGRVKWLMKN